MAILHSCLKTFIISQICIFFHYEFKSFFTVYNSGKKLKNYYQKLFLPIKKALLDDFIPFDNSIIFANYYLDLVFLCERIYVCVFVFINYIYIWIFAYINYKQEEPYTLMPFLVFYFWNSELVILK